MDHWKPLSGTCTVTKGYVSSSTDTPVFTVDTGDQVELLAQYEDTWILVRSLMTNMIGTVPSSSLSWSLTKGSTASAASSPTVTQGTEVFPTHNDNDSRAETPVESNDTSSVPPVLASSTSTTTSTNSTNAINATNSTTTTEAPLTIKMERVSRTWRSNLRRALAAGDRATYEKLANQVSQLSEWRRQKMDIEENINLVQTTTSTVNVNLNTTANTLLTNNSASNANNNNVIANANGILMPILPSITSSSSSSSSSTNYYALFQQKESIPSSSTTTLSSGIVASSSKKLATIVNESILNLIESTTQQREGLVTPRTDTDEPANEENTGIMSLLRMHTDSEKRLQTSSKVPTSASEALVAEVTKGIHGGPTVTNERATDVSGLWNSAAPDINMNNKTIVPMETIAEGLAFLQANEVSHSIVQLLIELQTIPAFRELNTGGILIISVWDALSGTFISQDAAVTFDASGRPILDSQTTNPYANIPYVSSGTNNRSTITLGRVRNRNDPTGTDSFSQQTTWSQCLFINIPRTLITAGKSYVVFRLFRRGALKESRITLTLGNNTNTSLTSGFINSASNTSNPTTSTNKNNLLSSSSLSTRFLNNNANGTNGNANTSTAGKPSSPESLASYIRPLGTAILSLPTVLPRLADGTPHRPAEPIVFMRPSKGEESRYFGLHRVLIAEKERDIEQEGRRKALGSLINASNTVATVTMDSTKSGAVNTDKISSTTITTGSTGTGVALSTDGIESTMQLVRCSRIGALPIVVRCFSSLSLPTLTDIRYNHLFSSMIKQGNVAYPLSWTWGSFLGPNPAVPSTLPVNHSNGTTGDAYARNDTSSGSPAPLNRTRTNIGSPNESMGANGGDYGTLNGISHNGSVTSSVNKLSSASSIDVTSLALSGVHILPKTFDFSLMNNKNPLSTTSGNLNPNSFPGENVSVSAPVASVIPQGLSQLLHRDVLYVTLRKGLFTQDKKMSPRNVQIRVTVLTHRGEMLPCLLRGVRCGLRNENSRAADNYLYSSDFVTTKENNGSESDDAGNAQTSVNATDNSPPITLGVPEYRSSVYYHCNSPVFDETLSILIPSMDQFETSHILFTFWHASSTVAKTDPFAFTFLPLADITGAALRDGKHVLRCYRPTANIQAGKYTGLPTYLVSPVVDTSGLELIPPTPVPYVTRTTNTNQNTNSGNDNGILSADHVRSACNRHIPITAMPIHLGSSITSAAYNPSGSLNSSSSLPHRSTHTSNNYYNNNGNVSNKTSFAPVGASVFGLSSSSVSSTVSTVNSSGSVGALSASFIAGATALSSSPFPNPSTVSSSSSTNTTNLSHRGQRAALLGILNRPSPSTPSNGTGANDKTLTQPSAPSTSDWTSKSTPKENGSFKQWSTRVRSTSISIINNLGLETNNQRLTNGSTNPANDLGTVTETDEDTNVQKLTELEPLVLRKDTFEIETRLVSDAKSSIAELHTLQRWKVVSKATLHTALVSLTTLVTHPRLLLRIFPKLLTILCEILSSFATDETMASTSVSGNSHNTPLSNSSIEKPNSKVLSATITLLVAIFDCLFSDFRLPRDSTTPSSNNGNGTSNTYNHKLLSRMETDIGDTLFDSSTGGIMDNYSKENPRPLNGANASAATASTGEGTTNWPSPSSTWLPSMPLPSGDGYIRSHILEAYLRTDFSSPSLHRILMPALNALGTAALQASMNTNEDTTISSLQLSIPESSNTLPYPFIFQYRTVIRSFNCMTALLQLVLASFKQTEVENGENHDDGLSSSALPTSKETNSSRLPQEFGKFRTQLASFLSSLVSLVQRSHEYSVPSNHDAFLSKENGKKPLPFPPWILQPQCCIYRQFVDILSQLDSIVTKEETIALYQRILTAIPIIHRSHVKVLRQIPLSLRISLLLCGRSIVANNLLEDKVMYHALVPPLVKILSAYMNSSSVTRAISLRIVAALLHLRETFTKQINRQSKGKKNPGDKVDDFSRENWCFSLLLAELTRATLGIAQGIVAPGDIVSNTGYYRATEDALIVHNLRLAGIPIPEPPWLGITNTTDTNKSSAGSVDNVPSSTNDTSLQALDKLCCVLPEVVHEEVYGPHVAFLATMVPNASPVSSSLDSSSARSALEISAFVEKGLRSAISSWMSLVWSISDPIGANLLASIAPLQISFGPAFPQISSFIASSTDFDSHRLSAIQRIRLGCQLLHTAIQLLGLATLPSSWLVMNMLLHTCILKIYRWIASYLASCYRGTVEDDELYARLSAHKMLTTINTIASSSSTTTRNMTFSSSFAAHKLVHHKFTWCLAKPLWELFIEVTIALLTSPLFAPETLRPVRRQAVAERYGDRRSEVVKIFRQTWAGILATPTINSNGKTVNSASVFGHANGTTVPVFPFNKSNLRSGPLTSVGNMTSNNSKNTNLTIPEADFYQRNIFTPEKTSVPVAVFTNRSSVGTNDYQEGVCASLRLSLSSQLVASMLDLTHCMNNDVATLARDIYLDLIRAELRMQKLRCQYANSLLQQILLPTDAFVPSLDDIPVAFINLVRTNSNVTLLKNLIEERFSGLPEIERLTIDAIDILVARKGPSLVIPRTSTVASTTGSSIRSKLSTLRSVNSGLVSSPGGTGTSLASPSSRTLAGSTSTNAGTGNATKPKGTIGTSSTLSAYVPPSDNLIMSLFAPKRLQGSLTAKTDKLHRPSITARTTSLLMNEPNSSGSTGSGRSIPQMFDAVSVDDTIVVPVANPDNEDNDPTSLLRNRTVVKFLGEIRMLYAMLSALSRYPATPEWEDERAQAALTLINYLRTTHRTDMYAKYVTYLTEMHTTLNNSAEAALSFLLHADILDWSDIHLWHVRSGDRDLFPAQTSAARLEAVLLRSVSALSSSQCWEEAAALSEVLLRRYESVTIEYSKLAELLRVRATLFDRMARAARIHPQYFIVMYNGNGFPKNIRGKLFIYRGGPSERIIDFEERLLKKWPQATKTALTLTEFSVTSNGSNGSTSSGTAMNEEGMNTSMEYEQNQLADDEEEDEMNDEDGGSSMVTEGSKDTVRKMEISFASVTVVSASTMNELFEPKGIPGITEPTDTGTSNSSAIVTPTESRRYPPTVSLSSPLSTARSTSNSLYSPLGSSSTGMGNDNGSGLVVSSTPIRGLVPVPVARSVGAALHSDTSLLHSPIAGTATTNTLSSPSVPSLLLSSLSTAGIVNPVLVHVGTTGPTMNVGMMDNRSSLLFGTNENTGNPSSGLGSPVPATPGKVTTNPGHKMNENSIPNVPNNYTGSITKSSNTAITTSTKSTLSVPQLIRQGQDHAGVRYFLYQRPFRYRTEKTNNEYLDMWIRKYYIVTYDAFPTTHRRSLVTSIKVVILNPIEAAITVLNDKTLTLKDLIEKAAAGPDRQAEQNFTQALQGVVDAAVSGGIANYRPFFTGEFRTTHPEIANDLDIPYKDPVTGSIVPHVPGPKAHLMNELKYTLLEQIRTVARGIRVHAIKCSEDLLPLHAFLCERFDQLTKMIKTWGI